MSHIPFRNIPVLLILGFCMVLALTACPSTQAGDVDSVLKELNDGLRGAEKDMFGGKTDKAVASLEDIKSLILRVQQEDPNNSKLKPVQKKFEKLVKDLERITGKDLGGGSLTVAAVNTPATLPEKTSGKTDVANSPVVAATPIVAAPQPAGAAEKLPHQARRPFDQAARGLNNIETLFTNLDNPNYNGNKSQLVSRIDSALETIANQLDEARKAAQEKGVSSHPSLDEAEARLKELNGKAVVAKEKYSKQQAMIAEQAQQIEADVLKMKQEYDRLNPLLGAATGTVIYYNDLPPARSLLDQLKAFEANDRAPLAGMLESFSGKYGHSQAEIDAKATSMGYVGEYYSASYHYLELSKGLVNINVTGPVMAEDLARKAREMIGGSGKTHDFSKLEQYEKAREYLALAQQFDGNNSLVNDLTATINQDIAAGMKEFGKKIDAQTWPKQASNAPDNAEELTRIAKEWFENSPDWGSRLQNPYTVLEVVITGPWSVQKKNLLEEPVMYGLPVAVAVQKADDKKDNIARVFSLTLRTVEMRGAKMEPPFDHATVGNSFYIRPASL